ncbi:MAG: Hsp20/alpha crystallin family protein [Candidatus Krumholzibacteriia bacterium]
MIAKHLRLAEEDERDPLHDMFGLFTNERFGRGTVRIHSDLTWEPPTDIAETESEIVVTVDIAGMTGKDISVVTDGKTLRINGTRRSPTAPGAKQFHMLEIQCGPFERAVELPGRVDPAKVSAHYSKGMLQIRIRKLDLAEYVKKVEID